MTCVKFQPSDGTSGYLEWPLLARLDTHTLNITEVELFSPRDTFSIWIEFRISFMTMLADEPMSRAVWGGFDLEPTTSSTTTLPSPWSHSTPLRERSPWLFSS
jgi:hypothetical protein